MTNNTFSDDNIQNTEDPMPETVKNFALIQAIREVTDENEDEKEKRK